MSNSHVSYQNSNIAPAMHRPHSPILILIPIILILFLLPTRAVATSTPLIARSPTPANCTFPGDENTYGLGIRIGLYLQWLSTTLANNFVPSEAPAMRVANINFHLAAFIALMYRTIAQRGRLAAVEAFLLLVLCTGGVCSGRGTGNAVDALEGEEPRTNPDRKRKAMGPGSLFRTMLGAATLYYGVWLAYVGLDALSHPPPESGCRHVVFWFAKVALFGWYRVFLKVIFTIAASYGSLSLVWNFYVVLRLVRRRGMKGVFSGPLDPQGVLEGAIHTLGSPSQAKPRMFTVLMHTTFSLDLPVFVLITEFTISWNGISGVNGLNSTGQLIPIVRLS
ncbi:hypothetical protein BU26DRAFT_552538 [Trematosphaeria pertusa]|uniref:Uncharacterized protein n=1 Tax=Trematosphaeria pertusa TaxID=390896 RepID=A0A6A6I8J4_9PLEO|nr:uncharacterized protein BU26DRAFT_552538 [Trematosphaeria pertusa]KAF2246539.1 hypothetical protein BU26DRAFT_552538 [Trematosphaeria pertusa]